MRFYERRVGGIDCGDETRSATKAPKADTEDLEKLATAIRKSHDGRVEGSPEFDSKTIRPPEIRFGYEHLLPDVGCVATGLPRIYYCDAYRDAVSAEQLHR